MNIYKCLNYGKKNDTPVFSKALKVVFNLFWENIFMWT